MVIKWVNLIFLYFINKKLNLFLKKVNKIKLYKNKSIENL